MGCFSTTSNHLVSPLDDGSTPDRIAQIMGPPDQAQHAAEIISDLLRSVQAGGPPGHGGGRGRGRGQGNWNMGPPGGLQEFSFTVPTMKTGLIIGKGKWLLCWFTNIQVNMLLLYLMDVCEPLQVVRQSKASVSSLEPGSSSRGTLHPTLTPTLRCLQSEAPHSRSTTPGSWWRRRSG